MSCKRALFVFLTLVFVLSFMQEPVSGQTCSYLCYTENRTIEKTIHTDCSSCSPSHLCRDLSFFSNCKDGTFDAQWYTSFLDVDYSVKSVPCPSYITFRLVNYHYLEANTICFDECCSANDVAVKYEPYRAKSDGHLYKVDYAGVAKINADCFVGTIAWAANARNWSINGESTDAFGVIVYIPHTGSICAY
jgi:hypothetical protein